MAFRHLYLVIILFVVSCAQVKSLGGGPEDENAPVPLGIKPGNEAINFKGQAIAIAFDEYIKLNNPNQTVSIMPNDVKVNAKLQDKTLLLYWEEQLRENTTYSIFLNKTVRDITESNDSIIQLVFSTGAFIDSLSYTTFVVDAQTNQPKKNVVVGLFDHPDSLKPLYYAQTNGQGKATLNYLRSGDYFIRAFDDASGMGKITKTSAIAFKEEAVTPDTNYIDSIPMRMFLPEQKPDITTFNYTAPSTFIIGANRSLEQAKLTLNGQIIPTNQIRFLEKDSLVVLFNEKDTNTFILTATTDDWTDTTRLRVPTSKSKIEKIISLSQDYRNEKPIVLTVPDFIYSIDTSLISIFNFTDSTELKNYTYELKEGNELHLFFPEFNGEKIKLILEEEALQVSKGWTTERFEKTYSKRKEKEFGTLIVTIDGYEKPIIIELITNKNVVKKEYSTGKNQLVFEELEPGDYTFRIIVDENNNGQWDSGDFEQKIQPEEIHLYSTPTKVRANWEIDVELQPK